MDDYHTITDETADNITFFLLEHIPPSIQVVVITREDPDLSLARLRGRGQLTELRAVDLCFSSSETADFLDERMRRSISSENLDALEKRKEGWIADLQMTAVSMQGYEDVSEFIKSLTGSHRVILDYLAEEEVLQQQIEDVQRFLLCTSILK